PTDKVIAGLEVQRGGTPSGQRQPLATVLGYITKVFTHQMGALQIMVLGDELIELLNLIGGCQPHDQMVENLLLIGRLLAKDGCFFLFHAGSIKKRGRVVPQNMLSHSPPKACCYPKTRPMLFSSLG